MFVKMRHILSMLPGYFIYPAEQVPGAYRVWVHVGYGTGTPRGVLNYFNRFDRPIRSLVRLGAVPVRLDVVKLKKFKKSNA
jgi:hypothetical protein